MRNLIIILGDQLNCRISSLKNFDKQQDVIFMCEVYEEATYVKHHKKKLAFIFTAMRHFSEALEAQGYKVIYTKLNDKANKQSFSKEIGRIVKKLKPEKIILTEPSEWRVLEIIKKLQSSLPCSIDIIDDDRFFCDHETFKKWAKDKKQLRMEHFYQMLRKKHDILMNGKKPIGGQWNFDSANRKALPKDIDIPKPKHFKPSNIAQTVIALIKKKFPDHFGDCTPFYFAKSSEQAQEILEDFIKNRLPYFGDYQDAMHQAEPWLFHSHLSFYLNCGLLLPDEVIDAAIEAYNKGKAPLNAVEGFVRQILGWREFIRGIYWLEMPNYHEENYFNAKRALPEFFWTANTKMNCLAQCINDTKVNAYAHHIQRLMVIGNFALLTELNPKAVQDWYLLVYADAYDWVEMPNVIGMILFADGGLFASKPYIASGNYINKMSNYCQQCQFNVKQKTGDDACPFNYLYWYFLDKHQKKLKNNKRLVFPYKNLENMSKEQINRIQKDAEYFLNNI